MVTIAIIYDDEFLTPNQVRCETCHRTFASMATMQKHVQSTFHTVYRGPKEGK